MARAVIFDLDGVLVDSEPLSLGVLAEEMRALGIHDATADEVGRQFLGVSLKVIRAYVADRLGRPVPEAFVERFEDRLLATYPDQLRVIAGVPALLDQLQAAGIHMAIATGGSLRRMGKRCGCRGWTAGFRAGPSAPIRSRRASPRPICSCWPRANWGWIPPIA